jgi:hypothetical protein
MCTPSRGRARAEPCNPRPGAIAAAPMFEKCPGPPNRYGRVSELSGTTMTLAARNVTADMHNFGTFVLPNTKQPFVHTAAAPILNAIQAALTIRPEFTV